MLPSENFRFKAPFDLHVLGAPPAFVLSQDQTLNLMVSKAFRLQIFLRVWAFHSFSIANDCLCFSSEKLWNLSRVFIRSTFLLYCLIFKIHSPASSFWAGILFYHILCLLSSTFCGCSPHRTAFLFYHSSLPLVKSFFDNIFDLFCCTNKSRFPPFIVLIVQNYTCQLLPVLYIR